MRRPSTQPRSPSRLIQVTLTIAFGLFRFCETLINLYLQRRFGSVRFVLRRRRQPTQRSLPLAWYVTSKRNEKQNIPRLLQCTSCHVAQMLTTNVIRRSVRLGFTLGPVRRRARAGGDRCAEDRRQVHRRQGAPRKRCCFREVHCFNANFLCSSYNNNTTNRFHIRHVVFRRRSPDRSTRCTRARLRL
jgi:hypothetical protein